MLKLLKYSYIKEEYINRKKLIMIDLTFLKGYPDYESYLKDVFNSICMKFTKSYIINHNISQQDKDVSEDIICITTSISRHCYNQN